MKTKTWKTKIPISLKTLPKSPTRIREVLLTDRGEELADVYIGPAGLLTGLARKVQEAREQAKQIAALHAEFEAHERDAKRFIRQSEHRGLQLLKDRLATGRHPAPKA